MSLVFKIGADTSALKRGLKGASQSLTRFAKLAKVGMVAGVGAAVTGVTLSIRGMHQAIKEGSRLADAKAMTGIDAGDLKVIGRALEEVGGSAQGATQLMADMNRTLGQVAQGKGRGIDTLKQLGLSLESMSEMNQLEKFSNIMQKVSQLPNIEAQADALQNIFKGGGRSLIGLANNASALESASTTVGKTAQIWSRSAGMFDRAANLISAIRYKIEGFFAGMAESLSPMLIKVLEQVNKLDFSGIGQRIGETVAAIIAFLQSEGPRGLLVALKEGTVAIGGFVYRSMKNAFSFGFGILRDLLDHLTSKFMDHTFWQGLLTQLNGIFKSLVGSLQLVLADFLKTIPGMKRKAALLGFGAITDLREGRQLQRKGRQMQIRAGDGKSFSQAFGESVEKEGKNFSANMKIAYDLLADQMGKGKKALEPFFDVVKSATQEAQAKFDPRAKPAGDGSFEAQAAAIRERLQLGRLQQIGGAAVKGPSVQASLQKQANSYLKQLVDQGKQKQFAVYG